MSSTETASTPPAVSVIIPARNEELCLGTCLLSIVSQEDVSFEVIVVNDHSTDRTRDIASSFSDLGVRVIDAGPLPPGWTGKNNAVTTGAQSARAQWLLFTDADTIHRRGSLARAIEEANRHHAAMLSYSPKQIVKTFWERAVMPVIFAELAANYRPSLVSNPKSSAAAANGQYILIAREAYDAVGGHAAIASCLLEDVALARSVKRSGRKIFFRYGADAVRARMYRNYDQLREGWTKNLALLFRAPLRLAVLRAIEFVLIVFTIAIAIAGAMREHWRPAAAVAVLAVVLCVFFFKRIVRAHFSWSSNLLAVFGLSMFSYLLLRSARAHANGSVPWKGRSYSDERCPLPTAH